MQVRICVNVSAPFVEIVKVAAVRADIVKAVQQLARHVGSTVKALSAVNGENLLKTQNTHHL